MRTDLYDQGYWHYASPNFPKSTDPVLGCTHIAFFVRWCAEQDFLDTSITRRAPEELAALLQRELTASVFFREVMDETFSAEDLTEEGRRFADRYYEKHYLSDYARVMKNVYLISDTEKNYQKVKAVMDSRYREGEEAQAFPQPRRLSFRKKKQR